MSIKNIQISSLSPGSKHGSVSLPTQEVHISGLTACIHSDDFSRGYRRVSPFRTQVYVQSRPREADIGGGGGTDFQQLVQEGCLGCNVVISDKRLPGDTHCAPLAASTLSGFLRRGEARVAPMFTHTHVTNRARHVPLVTVHYVANRDISLGHHPPTSKLRVSGQNLPTTHNRELIITQDDKKSSYFLYGFNIFLRDGNAR